MWDPAVVTAGFQKAIAVMTATVSDEPREDSPALATRVIASYVKDESVDGLVNLTTGLQNLCSLLLVLRQDETGNTPLQTLQMISGTPGNPDS